MYQRYLECSFLEVAGSKINLRVFQYYVVVQNRCDLVHCINYTMFLMTSWVAQYKQYVLRTMCLIYVCLFSTTCVISRKNYFWDTPYCATQLHVHVLKRARGSPARNALLLYMYSFNTLYEIRKMVSL